MKTYKVICDTREQKPYVFDATDVFTETIHTSLKTGDYSLQGYEEQLCIERKASTGEFAQNIFEKRFIRELQRMENYKWAFVILEFSMTDVLCFPEGSGIPKDKWKKLKMTNKLMLKNIIEFQAQFNTKILFCDTRYNAMQVVESIFKRFIGTNGKP